MSNNECKVSLYSGKGSIGDGGDEGHMSDGKERDTEWRSTI